MKENAKDVVAIVLLVTGFILCVENAGHLGSLDFDDWGGLLRAIAGVVLLGVGLNHIWKKARPKNH